MTAALDSTNLNMTEVAKRLDPDGGMAQIIEQMAKMTPELDDAVWIEGNLPTGHRISLRNALPTLTWRLANQGVPGSKSAVDQVDETCGQLAGHCVVDEDTAGLGGNAVAVRASEDAAFVAAMANEVATGLFYHSHSSNPERFTGLSPRLASTTGLYGGQVLPSEISASGSDQASAWWVCWGARGVYMIYPKGTVAGLKMEDMGKQAVTDADGNRFPAFETFWKWHVGLCVEDYRKVVRVPNIDTSAIAETGTLLLQSLLKGYYQLYKPDAGRCVLYVNRKVAFYLESQAIMGAVNSTLKYEDFGGGGKKTLTFQGCPVRVTDSLLNTEDIIT